MNLSIDRDRARRAWRKLLIGLLLLSVLSAGSLMHIVGGPGNLLDILLNIRLDVLIASFSILFIAEIVKSWRLTLIGRLLGFRIPVKDSLLARISGRFVGVLTPAYAGATPTRAIIISAYTGLSPGNSFGLSVYESILDSFIPVFFSLLLLIPLLPDSWLSVLVALFILGMWIGGIGYASTDKIERFLRRINAPEELVCYVSGQRKLFLSAIKSSTSTRILFPTVTVTLISHAIEAYALYIVLTGHFSLVDPVSFIKAFILLEASYVLTMSPTPGGSVFFEYGLSDIMNSYSLVLWRVVFLLFSILPGAVILVAIKSVRNYIEQALVREVKDCASSTDNEDI